MSSPLPSVSMYPKQSDGFTLIEVMVAVSIFSIMIIIVLGLFSRFVAGERRDIGEFRLQEDLRLALELLNREARLGYGSTYRVDGEAFTFRNQAGQCVTYRLHRGALQRAGRDSVSGDSCPVIFDGQFESLTSAQTIISSLRWRVLPARLSNDRTQLASQGTVSVAIKATSRAKGDREVALQNTVTARQFIPYPAP